MHCFLLQLRIRARDNGEPNALTALEVTTYNVRVLRDLFTPVITNLGVTQNLARNANPGDNVYTVIATDDDDRIQRVSGSRKKILCYSQIMCSWVWDHMPTLVLE